MRQVRCHHPGAVGDAASSVRCRCSLLAGGAAVADDAGLGGAEGLDQRRPEAAFSGAPVPPATVRSRNDRRRWRIVQAGGDEGAQVDRRGHQHGGRRRGGQGVGQVLWEQRLPRITAAPSNGCRTAISMPHVLAGHRGYSVGMRSRQRGPTPPGRCGSWPCWRGCRRPVTARSWAWLVGSPVEPEVNPGQQHGRRGCGTASGGNVRRHPRRRTRAARCTGPAPGRHQDRGRAVAGNNRGNRVDGARGRQQGPAPGEHGGDEGSEEMSAVLAQVDHVARPKTTGQPPRPGQEGGNRQPGRLAVGTLHEDPRRRPGEQWQPVVGAHAGISGRSAPGSASPARRSGCHPDH